MLMRSPNMYDLLARAMQEEAQRQSRQTHVDGLGLEQVASRSLAWRSRLARFFVGVSLRLDAGAALGSLQARNRGA